MSDALCERFLGLVSTVAVCMVPTVTCNTGPVALPISSM